jgi:hypothetical protein
MPKTFMSTTIINSPDKDVSYGFSMCPIKPHMFKGDQGSTPSWAVGIKSANGDHIYWDEGLVRKNCADQTVITWINKPSLSDAIDLSKVRKGEYYRFYQDGSVEVKYEMSDTTYYWSEEIDGNEEGGTIIWNHFNKDIEEYEQNETPVMCKQCGGDSRGSYGPGPAD